MPVFGNSFFVFEMNKQLYRKHFHQRTIRTRQLLILSRMAERMTPMEFDFSAPPPPEENAALPPPPKKGRGRRSMKDLQAHAEPVIPADEELNKKQYYGIMQVAAMFGVNASLLRFWEAECGFQLRKNKKGDRFFTPADIRRLELIYDLLRRRKLTIDGARDYLKNEKKAKERHELVQNLQQLRAFLLELKAHL